MRTLRELEIDSESSGDPMEDQTWIRRGAVEPDSD